MEGRKHIKAKPIPTKSGKGGKVSNRALWARICYYYPQYTLEEASRLSVRDIRLLLNVANEIEAERFFNLTQIAAAPHTKKGKGVKQLTDYFQSLMR